MAGVVDVFAGAAKVHKLLRCHQFGAGFKLGLDPVLHRLHVMVGGLLNLLDRFAIEFREVLDQAQQVGAGAG